jgi:hypothetical protein
VCAQNISLPESGPTQDKNQFFMPNMAQTAPFEADRHINKFGCNLIRGKISKGIYRLDQKNLEGMAKIAKVGLGGQRGWRRRGGRLRAALHAGYTVVE